MDEIEDRRAGKPRTLTIFGRNIPMPRSRLARIVVGGLFICGGILGFLPVLGFWMVPFGLLILSYEFATVRRWRRRFEIWWAERRGRRRTRRR